MAGKSENGRERETDMSSFPCLCGMTSLCTAAVFVNQGRSGMFVGRFLGAGKREARKEEKQEREKEGS